MKKSDTIRVKRKGKTVEIAVEYRNIPKKDRAEYKRRFVDRLSEVHKLKLVFK
mgnify:CR=1 FL=1